MLLPDVDKNLIGLEVVNSWSLDIYRVYPSLPYRFLKYALLNCPRLQLLQLNCVITNYNILLSPSRYIGDPYVELDKSNPAGTSQEYLKYVRFKGSPPTQDYMDIISRFLPNIDTIRCEYDDTSYKSAYNDARRNSTSLTFDLTAFKKLKSFHMDIEVVVDLQKKIGELGNTLLLHFKYADEGEDDAFYSIQKADWSYQMTTISQQIILDYSQNEELSTKLVTFEFSSKIEEFTISQNRCRYFGQLRFGEIIYPSSWYP